MTSVLPSSKHLANELNSIQSPSTLFKAIEDAIETLKNEYSSGWEKRENYQKKVQSLLGGQTADEISSYVEAMRKYQKKVKFLLKILGNSQASNIQSRSRSSAIRTRRMAKSKIVQKQAYYDAKTDRTKIVNITESKIIDNAQSNGNKSLVKVPVSIVIDVPVETRLLSPSTIDFGEFYDKAFIKGVARKYRASLYVKVEEPFDDEKGGLEMDNNIAKYYHDNYLGQNEIFESPFGIRPVIYCDWTASGKSLKCVEKYIEKELLTLYANTHTTTSITGIQTSKFRSEARSIILQSLGGDIDADVVVFTGSGVTGAIYKLAHVLIQEYDPQRTVVFVSIYEHNSNLYIWKELGIKVIVIPETDDNKHGGIDLNTLKTHLELYTTSDMKSKYDIVIGSFTAASNVSGIIASVDEITALLHEYGALSFWDYATAGPYLDIGMTNASHPELSKDAVFLSTHKFLGGPGAPGILCAKRKLFANYVPVVPGGGTVFVAYGTNEGEYEYLDNIEEREEGGTPDIIGSIRAAFAFLIKDRLSTRFIEHREKQFLDYFIRETKGIDNLLMMGNMECNRLPVLSFLISHTRSKGLIKSTKYLHHNFIAALLNDLFGIQGRGGCACAGMYGVSCLKLDEDDINHFRNEMKNKKNELARFGYFRINLHYTLTAAELEYIVSAVKYVCAHGWKFLPLYDVRSATGNYYHRDIVRKPDLLQKQLRSLLDVSFDECNGEMKWKQKHLKMEGESLQKNLKQFFKMANEVLLHLKEYLPYTNEFENEKDIHDPQQWYWLPSELYNEALVYASKNQHINQCSNWD